VHQFYSAFNAMRGTCYRNYDVLSKDNVFENNKLVSYEQIAYTRAWIQGNMSLVFSCFRNETVERSPNTKGFD